MSHSVNFWNNYWSLLPVATEIRLQLKLAASNLHTHTHKLQIHHVWGCQNDELIVSALQISVLVLDEDMMSLLYCFTKPLPWLLLLLIGAYKYWHDLIFSITTSISSCKMSGVICNIGVFTSVFTAWKGFSPWHPDWSCKAAEQPLKSLARLESMCLCLNTHNVGSSVPQRNPRRCCVIKRIT